MNVIIVGCGRVGVELALSIHQDHAVTVIDTHDAAFDRLGPDFTGRTVQGEGLDRDVLLRAGIETADALAAVTASDNVNAIVARIAREGFGIERVVVRIYNPRRSAIYKNLDIKTVSSSSWGAQRIEQLLIHPKFYSLSSNIKDEVQIYEMTVPPEWNGHKLAEMVPLEHVIPATLVRRGQAKLPRPDITLENGDVLQMSASLLGAKILRKRVHANVNLQREG